MNRYERYLAERGLEPPLEAPAAGDGMWGAVTADSLSGLFRRAYADSAYRSTRYTAQPLWQNIGIDTESGRGRR